MHHLAPTLFQRPDQLLEPLYVVTTVFNPSRYRSRWKLYEDFKEMVAHSGAILFTVEVAFGDRDFVLGSEGDPFYLPLRTQDELWLKENSLNLIFERLPRSWRKAAWIDADISLARPDWANETSHLLEHHPIVQLFSVAQDLNSNYEPFSTSHSFAYSYLHHEPFNHGCYPYGGKGQKIITWHPGYAWAIRREAFDQLGGLIDWGICGAADFHMATALIGEAPRSIFGGVQGPYRDQIMLWQDRALRYLKKNIGYVPGLLLHYWHGPKEDRRYMSRWEILTETKFNPVTDLKRDWQGLNQLVLESDRQFLIRDLLRKYFSQRNEDAL